MQRFKNESYSHSLDRENTELSKRLNRYHEIQKYHFDFNCEKPEKKGVKTYLKYLRTVNDMTIKTGFTSI